MSERIIRLSGIRGMASPEAICASALRGNPAVRCLGMARIARVRGNPERASGTARIQRWVWSSPRGRTIPRSAAPNMDAAGRSKRPAGPASLRPGSARTRIATRGKQ
ncbi:hypothetical protein GCM10023170_032710 [Phytohabitans houttuyneae]